MRRTVGECCLLNEINALCMTKYLLIALTVYARESDRAHALSVGFEEHLSKLFDIDELITTVACLTEHVQCVLTA